MGAGEGVRGVEAGVRVGAEVGRGGGGGGGGGAGNTTNSGVPSSPTAPRAPPLLPHLLVSCSLDDSRVPFWAPAKWVAAARQLQVRRLKGIKALGGCAQRCPRRGWQLRGSF